MGRSWRRGNGGRAVSRVQGRGEHAGEAEKRTELASDGPAISRSIAEVVAVAREMMASGGQDQTEGDASAVPRKGRVAGRRRRASRLELGRRRVWEGERAHGRGVLGKWRLVVAVCRPWSARRVRGVWLPLNALHFPHLASSFLPTWNDVTHPVVKLLAISSIHAH